MNVPSSMIAITFDAPGGPEVLQPRSIPVPVPGPGEVLIRVVAAGINAPDLQQRRGRYDPPPDASPLLGLEVGGEVAVLGPGTSRFIVGDQVAALCNGGGYAEFVAVPEGQVLLVPAGWPMIDAAALPETYFTVQQTLVMRSGLAPGMTVLIHGAAGGIGGAAIAIVRQYGAQPIAVVSSPEKAAYATRLGAVAVIDRSQQDFVAVARELTIGRGVDRIIDIVGGEQLGHNLDAIATEGVIVQLATLAGGHAEINAGLIVGKRLTVIGSTLRPQPRVVKAAIAASLMEQVWPALGDGRIAPPKIERFTLSDAANAHRAMEQRSHFGKLVLVTPYGETRA